MALSPQQSPAQMEEGSQAGVPDVTAAQFKAEITRLVTRFGELNQLGDMVAALRPNDKLQHPSGYVFGRRELRSYRTAFVNAMKNLSKLYAAAKRAKRTRRTTQRRSGFNIPIVVTENLRQFFVDANLGTAVDPSTNQMTDVPLVTLLPYLTSVGVTTSATLTPLFCIYATVNGLQRQDDRKFLSADDRLMGYFQQTFADLSALPEKVGKRGEVIAPFRPDNFMYAHFQSIVARNSIKPPKDANVADYWTPNQIALMELLRIPIADPTVANELDAELYSQAQEAHEQLSKEQLYASSTQSFYRKIREDENKIIRAEKRREDNRLKRQQQQLQAQQAFQQQQFAGLQPFQQQQ
jgi:hypothetical protein